MLAQNFLPGADLGVTDRLRDALAAVLAMLERDELRWQHCSPGDDPILTAPITAGTEPWAFNMAVWRADVGLRRLHGGCGTVGCIGGSAELVGRFYLRDQRLPGMTQLQELALGSLFYPCGVVLGDVTAAQAAQALRSYLTTGRPAWEDVLPPLPGYVLPPALAPDFSLAAVTAAADEEFGNLTIGGARIFFDQPAAEEFHVVPVPLPAE